MQLRRKLTRSIMVVTMAVLYVVSGTSSVLASSFQFMSDQEIMYYTPEDIAITGSYDSPGGGGNCVSLSGDSPVAKVWNFLKNDLGVTLSDEQVAGIMGNMQRESHIYPLTREGGNVTFDESTLMSDVSHKAWGLIQWDGGRRPLILAKLKSEKPHLWKYVTDPGYSSYSYGYDTASGNYTHPTSNPVPDADFDEILAFELDYLRYELTATGSGMTDVYGGATNPWGVTKGDGGTFLANLLKYNTIEAATYMINSHFERSGDTPGSEGMNNRITYAQNIYNSLKGSSASGGSGGGGCGDGSINGEITFSGDGNYAFPLVTSNLKGTSCVFTSSCANGGQSADEDYHPYHAIDIHANQNDVVAFTGGRVIYANTSSLAIMGGDGYIYFYQHLKIGSIIVSANQNVATGAKLGRTAPPGESDNNGADHLHFDVTPSKRLGGLYDTRMAMGSNKVPAGNPFCRNASPTNEYCPYVKTFVKMEAKLKELIGV